ncbi:hypothetical protein FHW67_003059 [Herbaspirillum sp. Sphag1AN]|uniref:CNP1-like family protein n=1 Tax=unclassified Herbaspirillum TaxID=2624150 RepID=UPI00160FD979|nr:MULTISPECIES: CNP1-like family protein [unclassified Herbaspirillum]MBB3213758.1 hypothetical protein [Herbaspirillum sp. Sphag1AN]MBB3246955.1 hypothetical protein [Herbaspirillum sp. Sphag64]
MPQRSLTLSTALFSTRRIARILVAGILLCSATVSIAAQPMGYDENEDDVPFQDEKAWQESAVQLPAAPQQENLVSYFVSPLATATSYVDISSLSVGGDNVVRFTLVTKTSGGATNTTYEGIRCETFEKKIYAFGRPDGSWSPARQPNWKRIIDYGSNRQEAALYKDYFCENAILAGNLKSIVSRFNLKKPITSTYDH